jgi:hypothetical protein
LQLEEFSDGLCLNNQSLGLIRLNDFLLDNLDGSLDFGTSGSISSLGLVLSLSRGFYIILYITFLGLSGLRVSLHWSILVRLNGGSGSRGLAGLLDTVLLFGSGGVLSGLIIFSVLFDDLDVLSQLGILGFLVFLALLVAALLLLGFLLFGLLILALLFGPLVVKLLIFSDGSLGFFPPVSLLLFNQLLASQTGISNESLDLGSLLSLWGSWILL